MGGAKFKSAAISAGGFWRPLWSRIRAEVAMAPGCKGKLWPCLVRSSPLANAGVRGRRRTRWELGSTQSAGARFSPCTLARPSCAPDLAVSLPASCVGVLRADACALHLLLASTFLTFLKERDLRSLWWPALRGGNFKANCNYLFTIVPTLHPPKLCELMKPELHRSTEPYR